MRYIPNTPEDNGEMLKAIGAKDFRELIKDVPEDLLLMGPLALPPPLSEQELLRELAGMAGLNDVRGYDGVDPAAIVELLERAADPPLRGRRRERGRELAEVEPDRLRELVEHVAARHVDAADERGLAHRGAERLLVGGALEPGGAEGNDRGACTY